jgi:hypothetical protein
MQVKSALIEKPASQ